MFGEDGGHASALPQWRPEARGLLVGPCGQVTSLRSRGLDRARGKALWRPSWAGGRQGPARRRSRGESRGDATVCCHVWRGPWEGSVGRPTEEPCCQVTAGVAWTRDKGGRKGWAQLTRPAEPPGKKEWVTPGCSLAFRTWTVPVWGQHKGPEENGHDVSGTPHPADRWRGRLGH